MSTTYPYVPIPSVISMHSISRYGHTTDISYLVTNDFEKMIDYYLGFSYICTVLFCILFVWVSVLLTLRILDWRVGCASGRSFQASDPDDLEDVAKVIVRTRICFIFFGLLVMGSSVSLMLTSSRVEEAGLKLNQYATSAVRELQKPIASTGNILKLAEDTVPLRQDVSKSLENFCPSIPLGDEIHTHIKDAIKSLEDLDDFYESKIKELQVGLNETERIILSNIIEKTSPENIGPITDGVVAYFTILILIVMCVVFGVVLAGFTTDSKWFATFEMMQSTVFFPTLVIMIIATWACTCGIAILAMMNADFCYGDPENAGGPAETMAKMIESYHGNEGDPNIAFQTMNYFAYGCIGYNPLRFVNDLESKIKKTNTTRDVFLESTEGLALSMLTSSCAPDVQNITDLYGDLMRGLNSAAQDVRDIKSILYCDKFSPLWAAGFDEAICREGANAVMWTFYSFLVVSMCGMVLFSLRAARNDVEILSQDQGIDVGFGSPPNSPMRDFGKIYPREIDSGVPAHKSHRR